MNSLTAISRLISSQQPKSDLSRKQSKRRQASEGSSSAPSAYASSLRDLDTGLREKALSDDEETLVDDSQDTPLQAGTIPKVALNQEKRPSKRKYRERSNTLPIVPNDSAARSVPIKLSVLVYNLLRRVLALLGIPLLVAPPRRSLVIVTTLPIPDPKEPEQPPAYESLDRALPSQPDESPPERPALLKPPSSSWRSALRRPLLYKSDTNSSIVSTDSEPEKNPSPPSSRRSSMNTDQHRPVKSSLLRQHQISLLTRPKTLVLDLDETLIHSTSRMGGLSTAAGNNRWSTTKLPVRMVEVVVDGRCVMYHVYKRPWVDLFLRKVSAWYDVVIFTASIQEGLRSVFVAAFPLVVVQYHRQVLY